jgi:hypothetical protein
VSHRRHRYERHPVRPRNIQRIERLEYGMNLVLAVRRAHHFEMFAEMTLATSDWKSSFTGGGLARWNYDIGESKWLLVEPCACLSLIAYRYNRPGD